MECCFAPMEGITGYIYRNAHHQVFGGITTYYTPFITPTQTRRLSAKELNDILPEHNQGMRIIPQILTNKAEDFLWAAENMRQLGYEEINLNLGCPSGTVVSKNRGAGFLIMTEELNAFLDKVCDGMEKLNLKFSVKTRIGKVDPAEWEELLEIYNRYPLERLIVHPRIRTDYYKNHPNLDEFERAVGESRNKLCYNGDIFSAKDYQRFHERFPQVDEIMLGRGLLANPALAEEICSLGGADQKTGVNRAGTTMTGAVINCLDKTRLRQYHDAILHGYEEVTSGDRNVLFKMKELWYYMGDAFADGEKLLKKVKKAQHMGDYEAAVSRLFAECELADPPRFHSR